MGKELTDRTVNRQQLHAESGPRRNNATGPTINRPAPADRIIRIPPGARSVAACMTGREKALSRAANAPSGTAIGSSRTYRQGLVRQHRNLRMAAENADLRFEISDPHKATDEDSPKLGKI